MPGLGAPVTRVDETSSSCPCRMSLSDVPARRGPMSRVPARCPWACPTCRPRALPRRVACPPGPPAHAHLGQAARSPLLIVAPRGFAPCWGVDTLGCDNDQAPCASRWPLSVMHGSGHSSLLCRSGLVQGSGQGWLDTLQRRQPCPGPALGEDPLLAVLPDQRLSTAAPPTPREQAPSSCAEDRPCRSAGPSPSVWCSQTADVPVPLAHGGPNVPAADVPVRQGHRPRGGTWGGTCMSLPAADVPARCPPEGVGSVRLADAVRGWIVISPLWASPFCGVDRRRPRGASSERPELLPAL